MTIKRRKFSSEEKVGILRQHLLEKQPISDICEHYGLNPNMFYRWQKEFFENGAAAFEKSGRKQSFDKKLEKKNTELQAKLSKKDRVIAEIMEDHIQLKKELGLG